MDCTRIFGLFSSGGLVRGRSVAAGALLALSLAGGVTTVAAQSDVRSTVHNLSSTGPGTVKAPAEDQVCVFCHTPHGANTSAKAPLWNRSGTTAQTYTRYTSSSLDANVINDGFAAQPGGSSLLCLSCHDGMIALGNVNVLRGVTTLPSQTTPTITLSGTTANKMPDGPYGALTGYTRNLGTNLTNDHPISITYNDDLAAADGELTRLTTTDPKQQNTIASAAVGRLIGIRSPGYRPLLPLEPTSDLGAGQVQCASCHDPHITKEKFLRLNRFQTTAAPTGSTFSEANDQICLACHPKLRDTWTESAHANKDVGDEFYATAAKTTRGFTGSKAVWEVACLNCHDTHTAQGSRRLLREGVGTTVTAVVTADPTGSYQPGSNNTLLDKVSAIENTCYQCHTGTSQKIIGTGNGTVPNIQSEFNKSVRMPIETASQKGTGNSNTSENHDIRNSNFVECRRSLGNPTGTDTEVSGDHLTVAQKTICDGLIGSDEKRHVECTDCHNPHRVRRNSKFYGTAADANSAKRTHDVGGAEGNVASGVLRGAWGVEPSYPALSATTWPQAPSSFTVKKGDPGTSVSTAKSSTYLTREYQLCFKCHSNYSNSDTLTSFPVLGNTLGGTPSSSANGLTKYTNVAAEFGSVNATDPASSLTDQGEERVTTTACGPAGTLDCNPTPTGPSPQTNNHRSWHPVMFPTGRNRDERNMSSSGTINLRVPFVANIGKQTMHCSDCHGGESAWTQDVGPNTSTQGPHGSTKPFLLKGDWNLPASGIGQTPSSPGVCANCHNPTGGSSGFAGSHERASHNADVKRDRACNFCHIAVPHGWKNKAFLANLNCVGPEIGAGTFTSGCLTTPPSGRYYSAAPYYRNAILKVKTWASSGSWSDGNCGPTSGTAGKDWMTDGSGLGNCSAPP